MKTTEKSLPKMNRTDEFDIKPEEMMAAGLHFGHKSSKTHPKMRPYIFGVRNTIHIFDVEKTAEGLRKALSVVKELVSENKILLLVGTKIQAKELIKEVALETGLPYVAERWLGGTITNFKIIKERVEYFKDLEKKKETGELEKYTKKEQLKFGEELEKLRTKFGGIKNLDRIPDAIFVVDIEKEISAVAEAKKKGIKVIGICDTSADPTLVDCPIPANDDAITSLRYILDNVKKVILEVKKKGESKKQEAEKE